MGHLLSRSILFFLGNIKVFEVCSYLGLESALGYALGKSIGDALLFVYLFAASAEVVSQP